MVDRLERIGHDAAVLAQIERLVTINSAMEVDLTGQVNAEQSGASYLGGTGGQVDFVRAGARSPGGRSIIALSATAKGGAISKIVADLSGPVTTARSDVDVIVTDVAVFRRQGDVFELESVFDQFTVADVEALTDMRFTVSPELARAATTS